MTGTDPTRPPLDADRLRASAPGSWRVEVSAADASTNLTVAGRARAGEPEGLVAVTEHQTAGRGRLDRVWETPPRSALTFSVLLRPEVAPQRWPWLPLLTGLAVQRALAQEGYDARLKWPNDVLLGEHKLAGILLERVETPAGPAAVVGIGLNASQAAGDLPVPHATSLWAATGREPDRTGLLAGLLAGLHDAYDRWRRDAGRAEGLRREYEAACHTLGRQVRVELPPGTRGAESLVGVAEGVDADGRLLVRTATRTVPIGAGDVVHVRPVE